jgi:tetratricopeptide (TPR) repeat protein
VTGLSRPPSEAYGDDMATLPPQATRPPRPDAPGPLAAGQVINGRYHVIRLLGKGGMGAVYHAWDEELGVGVALKVILPSSGEDPTVVEEMERRFKKELLLARQITHRNVVRIHDISEVEGTKFITMPYIKGQDLATTLKAGPLPVPRALALARQIVSGLAAAHEAGVVHRDLKPANVMVEEGEWALLMDFGIARSVRGGTTAGGTIAGTVVGTIDYMAPEQARGEVVDGRADIYAFGLIFYEMLSGRRQLAGDGAVSDLVARMATAPRPVRSVNPEVPEALDAVVMKCVQPAAADRYQSCAELLAALEGLDSEGRAILKPEPRTFTPKLVALAASLVVGVAGATYWAVGGAAPAADAQRPVVSVLIADFDNQAKDPIFDNTLEQALGLAIEGAPFISSYSRQAAHRTLEQVNPGAALDQSGAQLVARREGIQVILAGAVAPDGGGYALTVRAVESTTGEELASARAEADSKDQVLAAVSRLAASVRRSLGDVTPESEQITAAETFTASSLEAAQAYEEAQQLQRAGNTAGAIAAYQRVLQLDPGLGRAYSGLAAAYANSGQTDEADRHYKLAMEHLDRMTERERYRTRAGYYLFTRNNNAAIEELTALLEKFPADTAAMANLAFARFNRREFDAALDLGRKAAAVYPTAIAQTNVALFALYGGAFDEALKAANEAMKISQTNPKPHLAAALAHLASGRGDEAEAAYTKLQAVSASLGAAGLADFALYEGRAADAARLLEAGAAADQTEGNASPAARKLTALAHALRLQRREADAIRAVQRALAATDRWEVQAESALVYVELGRFREATALADGLRTSLRQDPQAYARVIDGQVLLARKQPREAVKAFTDAAAIADTWLGRLGLGRAYLELGAYTEAYSSFEACLRRRGEAAALFLDDLPTYHWLPAVHYYMGLAQQGLGSPAAAESFRTFLSIKQRGDDPLAADARRRLAS